jgi:hypothetical protein
VFPGPGLPPYTPSPGGLLPGEPRTASAEILPADEEPVDGRRDGRQGAGSKRLLPLLLVLVLLVVAGYLLKGLLGGGDDEEETVTPPKASASVSAPRSPATQTYSAAQIAQALKDPHFKHGYDAGKKKAAAGAVANAEATCREMGLAERTKGYPWGAHDRQGCLVALTS